MRKQTIMTECMQQKKKIKIRIHENVAIDRHLSPFPFSLQTGTFSTFIIINFISQLLIILLAIYTQNDISITSLIYNKIKYILFTAIQTHQPYYPRWTVQAV